MSGSTPEADVVTASDGICAAVRPGVDGPLAPQVRADVALQLLRELLLVRALVVEERRRRRVAGDRRAALEVLGVLREVLADQLGADDLAAALDHRAVGPAGERHLADAGHAQGVGEAEHHGEGDDGDRRRS